MWESLLGIRHEGCPISDASTSVPGVPIDNVSKADIPGNRGRRLILVRGTPGERETFASTCRDHESVVAFQRVSESAGSEAYYAVEIEYDEANPSVLSVLNARGVFHHGGAIVVQDGIEHWLVYSAEKTTIQELIDEIESYENEVSLYRTVDLQNVGYGDTIEFGILLSRLTSRQRTAFRTALELGYYDGDTGTTVSDIARELDVHETTAWEHLKKAENAILTDVGGRLFSTIGPEEA